MEKNTIITIFVVGLIFLSGMFFTVFSNPQVKFQDKGNKIAAFSIPKDILVLLNKSCTKCHNTNSDDDSAKKTLLIDEMQNLKKRKLRVALIEIASSVDSKMMPPRKYLKKNPEKVLSDDEMQKLSDWADDLAKELAKK